MRIIIILAINKLNISIFLSYLKFMVVFQENNTFIFLNFTLPIFENSKEFSRREKF